MKVPILGSSVAGEPKLSLLFELLVVPEGVQFTLQVIDQRDPLRRCHKIPILIPTTSVPDASSEEKKGPRPL